MDDGGSGELVGRARLKHELEALGAELDEVVTIAATEPIFEQVADGETIAGQTGATLDDYVWARDLVVSLALRVFDLPADEAERLELNADLQQLAFHLDEELQSQRAHGIDPETLGRSLTFLKRHIVRLRAEYDERRHLSLDPLERSLLTSLARDTKATYHRDYAHHYEAIGYRRPFVDKFYRDYSLTGIPDGLLLQLDDLARGGRYDRFVCVLKGGLPFTTMLEVLGVPAEQVVHVMAGRESGSHHEDTYMFRPLDFALEDLHDRSVLIVENNLATGSTLTHLIRDLDAAKPRRLGVFMDYILTDLMGIDAKNLPATVGYAFDGVHIGPWPARAADAADRDRAARLRLTLAAGLAKRAVDAPA